MTRRLCIIIIITLLTFIACNKEKWWFPNTTIYGKVTDYCTGLPAGNINLTLIAKPDAYSTLQQTVRSVTTESDGVYEFKFSASHNYYAIELDGSEVSFANGKVALDNINKGDHKEIDIVTINNNPKGYVKLEVKNTAPFNNADSIYIQFKQPDNPSSSYPYGFPPFQYYPRSYTGAAVDSTDVIGAFGCEPLKFNLKWTVIKNNVITNFADSIICPKGNTVNYNINY